MTTTLIIDSEIYTGAQHYARRHNVSVRQFVESTILQALSKPQAQSSSTYKPKTYSWSELNGMLKTNVSTEELRDEYMSEKYGV